MSSTIAMAVNNMVIINKGFTNLNQRFLLDHFIKYLPSGDRKNNRSSFISH